MMALSCGGLKPDQQLSIELICHNVGTEYNCDGFRLTFTERASCRIWVITYGTCSCENPLAGFFGDSRRTVKCSRHSGDRNPDGLSRIFRAAPAKGFLPGFGVRIVANTYQSYNPA